MAATEQELKDIIIELKLYLVKSKIPNGHCPYSYYHIKRSDDNLYCEDCDKCMACFLRDVEEQIREEVSKL